MRPVPEAIISAMDIGELTTEQLRELITIEAEELGLSFDEALQKKKEGTLPKNLLGSDIDFLFDLRELWEEECPESKG